MSNTTFCHCQGRRIDVDDCDGCGADDSWLYADDRYEDPPLYPAGHLASLTVEQLEKESSRQAGVQGAAGDNLDRPGIEDVIRNAEARCRLVENELKLRKESDGLKEVLAEALAKATSDETPTITRYEQGRGA
jgi:hypothetical protein